MYTLIVILEDIGCFISFILCIYYNLYYWIAIGPILYITLPFLNEIIYTTFSQLLYDPQKLLNYHKNLYKTIKNPIIYHPRYNLTACGIENVHPFDSIKYKRIYDILTEHIQIQTHPPYGRISRGLLLELGMSRSYLFSLNYSIILSKLVEVPLCILPGSILRWRILNPMLYATQGTIDAAVVALYKGWSINLSGGYHHASATKGGGFCIYPDIFLSIQYIRKYYGIKKCIIIDLDAHQGNGHERDYIEDKQNIYIIDFYNHHIYPQDYFAREAIQNDVHVDQFVSDSAYLAKIKDVFVKALVSFQPQFVLYNAGTDCLQGDPLGQMNLSGECIQERDAIVFRECLKKNIPICMVLSGGYQKNNAGVIAQSIGNLMEINQQNYVVQ